MFFFCCQQALAQEHLLPFLFDHKLGLEEELRGHCVSSHCPDGGQSQESGVEADCSDGRLYQLVDLGYCSSSLASQTISPLLCFVHRLTASSLQ